MSPNPDLGWVEVRRDGNLVVPRTGVAAMDLVSGKADPVYVKQGIYRSRAWTVPHSVYLTPVRVGETDS